MTVKEIVDTAIPNFFGTNKQMNGFGPFPFYTQDANAIKDFQEKYLMTFYMWEIGQETPAQHRLCLYTKLRNIMPYYRELYNSTLHGFDWWNNENYETIENMSGKRDGEENNKTTTSDSENKSKSGNVNETNTVSSSASGSSTDTKAMNDTPQNGLQDVSNLTYLTSYERDTNSNSSTGKSDGESNQESTETQTNSRSSDKTDDRTTSQTYGEDRTIKVTGKRGTITVSQMLKEYRETIINIDNMILQELKPLFMLIL